MTWLFRDLNSTTNNHASLATPPINAHHPVSREIHPSRHNIADILSPELWHLSIDQNQEIYEWLGLITLQSPRVCSRDSLDPYLSRYRVPQQTSQANDLSLFRWRGLMEPSWIQRLMILLRLVSPGLSITERQQRPATGRLGTTRFCSSIRA